ncbi:hypothetical protein VP01_2544g3 [Puccinia sorghi]|uniref:HTH CENPB-type domain-containing protein n=1 Tax=Puccinia sorghi TaxID=27349 RepID=A0A0L6V5C9_9BASI|nr:hypothetical protein VP01_2544g3 [Puccinia sorghi]
MNGQLEAELGRFEENCKRKQDRLNWIKEQLRNHQPISEDDNHFFEQFTNSLFHNLRRLLSQLSSPSSNKREKITMLQYNIILTHILSFIYLIGSSILHPEPDQSNKKPRHPSNLPFSTIASNHLPFTHTSPDGLSITNRSLTLEDIQANRPTEDSIGQQSLCSALSTPATTPGGTTATSVRRRELATPAQKAEILAWYHAHGSNQTQTAKHFDEIYPNLKLSQPLISGWLKSNPTLDEPGLPAQPTCSSSTTTTPSTSASTTTTSSTAATTATIPPTTTTGTTTATTTTTTTTNRRRQQKTKHVQVTEALEKWCQQAENTQSQPQTFRFFCPLH